MTNAQGFQKESPQMAIRINPANQNQESPEWANTAAMGLSRRLFSKTRNEREISSSLSSNFCSVMKYQTRPGLAGRSQADGVYPHPCRPVEMGS